MRLNLLNIIILLFLIIASSCHKLTAQTNQKSIDELRPLLEEEKYDDIIKISLLALHSKEELSLKDSFNVYNVLSYSLNQVGIYDNALEYAKKSIYLEAKLKSKKKPDYGFLIPFFNSNEQYDSSIYYLRIIIRDIVSNPKEIDNDQLAKSYNNIGFSFYLNNQLDSAELYYKKVINDTIFQKSNSPVYGLCIGNLGTIFLKKKDYEQALIFMKIDAELTKDVILESYNNALLGISECYFMLGDYNDALLTLNIYLDQDKKTNKTLLKGYRLLAKIYHKLHDERNSAIYLRKTIDLKDSLIDYERPSREFVNELSLVRFHIVEKDLILAKEEEKAQRLKNRVYILSLGLLLIIALVSFTYIRFRQLKNRKIQLLETELLSSDLKSRKKDLSNAITNLTYKRKFIDEVQTKLKVIQNKPEEELMKNIRQLIHEFNTYKNSDKNIETLQTDLDKVNASFFYKLSDKFPLLTEKDKEVCSLILLNLSSKDIANLRNVTPNAIKKTRQRIRKKLPIKDNEEIATFLNSL